MGKTCKIDDCENVLADNDFTKIISSQTDLNVNCFNTENSSHSKLKRDIHAVNNGNHVDDNCDLLPSVSKKPKFLINDLLSVPKAAVALIASVIAPNSLLTTNNNVNNNQRSKNQNLLNNSKKKVDSSLKKIKHSDQSANYSHKHKTELSIPLNFIPNGNSFKLKNVRCCLESENQSLWSKFHKIGTEMIITKPGR